MRFQKIRQYFSAPRINRYLQAAGNNQTRANKLYKANLKILQSFHPLLGITEVIIRNRINDVLSAHFTDPDWIVNQKNGFMVDPSLRFRHKQTGAIRVNTYLKTEVEKAEKRLRRAGLVTTSGKVIAEQTLGFWTDLFEVHHYKLLLGKPIQIFSSLPPGYGRKEICEELNNIRVFRNRVNHNEPICFKENVIDLTKAKEVYQSIRNILEWIDVDLLNYTLDIDRVQKNILAAELI